MSIYKGDSLIAGGRQCMPLLSFMWADHRLNHPSWLNSTTFSWQSGAVYQAAYQHLADDIDGKTLQSETVAGTTIQFYLADDGHKICPASEESNVAAIYNATGVAWYYIIDTANTRFKLPRTKFGFTGIRSGVGDYVAESLPNFEGEFDGIVYVAPYNTAAVPMTGTGALKSNGESAGQSHITSSQGANRKAYKLGLDASAGNSIYQNDAPVQQRATQMYLYFYVGEFTQTALENTAGLNAELFNGKADVSTVAHVVTEFQAPTSANGYTWYRKYADGWVEQGGAFSKTINTGDTAWSATLPIAMANYYYVVNVQTDGGYAGNTTIQCENNSTTQIKGYARAPSGGGTKRIMWSVSGMAA